MSRTRQTLQAKCRVRLAQAPVMQTNFMFCSFLPYIWLSTYSGGDNKLSTFIDPWGINPAIVILGGFFLFFCTLNEQNYLSILLFCSFHPSTLRSPRCSLYSPLNQTRWTWKSVPSRWYSTWWTIRSPYCWGIAFRSMEFWFPGFLLCRQRYRLPEYSLLKIKER